MAGAAYGFGGGGERFRQGGSAGCVFDFTADDGPVQLIKSMFPDSTGVHNAIRNGESTMRFETTTFSTLSLDMSFLTLHGLSKVALFSSNFRPSLVVDTRFLPWYSFNWSTAYSSMGLLSFLLQFLEEMRVLHGPLALAGDEKNFLHGLHPRYVVLQARHLIHTLGESFDELVLMTRGGQMIYVGPLGRHSQTLADYFEAIEGVPKITPGYNSNNLSLFYATGDESWTLIYVHKRNEALIKELHQSAPGSKDLYFETQFSQALACLCKQHWSYWRNPQYNVIGFLFTLTSKQEDLANAMGALFTSILFIGVNNTSSVQLVVDVERTIFYIEKAVGMFSALAYAFGQAADALGAIGLDNYVPLLQNSFKLDPAQEVRETCELALRRIEERKNTDLSEENITEARSPFLSVDPAAPASSASSVQELRKVLLDEEKSMYERYAALFSLRNRGGADAVDAIVAALQAQSALLRHEVAYVLGQLQDKAASIALSETLKDVREHPMVRHEAAEALGSIADNESLALLKQYEMDPEPIVSQSCEVALSMLEFEQSGKSFEYLFLQSPAAVH